METIFSPEENSKAESKKKGKTNISELNDTLM